MTETNQKQPKSTLLLTLVIMLLVIVCVQAWHMLQMQQQLSAVDQPVQTTEVKQTENTPAPQAESPAPALSDSGPSQLATTGDVTAENHLSPEKNQQAEVTTQNEDSMERFFGHYFHPVLIPDPRVLPGGYVRG